MSSDRSRPIDRLPGHVTPDAEVVLSCATSAPRVHRDVLLVHGAGCVAGFGHHVAPELLVAGAVRVRVDPHCDHDREALDELVATWQGWLGERVGWLEPATGAVWRPARPVDLSGRAALRRALLGRLEAGEQRSDEERLRDALRALGITELDEQQESAARVLAASGCTACGVCARACPHDALALVGEGLLELQHRPDRCGGDQACVRLCPVDALSVTGGWPLARTLDETPEVLAVVETTRCTVCRAPHPASEGDRCATCAYVKDRPFGTAMSVEEVLRMGRPGNA